ncbi:hypothetical protein CCB80_00880 [Armatimonadetes bacterium Uphvl-Ar1]|nr:hypothetical protein CCB80_00880 [Armatimonadetes bacterium Uphvl-Ar1]
MRRAATTGLVLATIALAVACPNTVPEFNAKASNGKTFTQKSFTEKPTILVFLKLGCPANPSLTPALNSLQKDLGDSVQIIGVTVGSEVDAKGEAEKIKAKFPIIADQSAVLVNGFKATRSFDMSMVATKTEAKWPKLWEGLSQKNMAEIIDITQKHGHEFKTPNLETLPQTPKRGCMF